MVCSSLRILSIYEALDGEANAFHQGSWTVFVRTAGCSIACSWCDTKYSWGPRGGLELDPAAVVRQINCLSHCRKVTLTGGEPLEQPLPGLNALFRTLLAQKYKVTVETSGCCPVGWLKELDENLALVIDYKPPSAHARRETLMQNFQGLLPRHVVKFVVQNDEDFDWAVRAIQSMRNYLNCQARMVLSPMVAEGKYTQPFALAEWVQKMRLRGLPEMQVGLNIQLHKIVYPTDARDEERSGVDYTRRKPGSPWERLT